ncbi:hypothetical protein BDQ17DRAFT_216761 [Cyathus striatus]|nr:hypothetical protein BDQ17DRAFT_216761 [Cyathus striatus]
MFSSSPAHTCRVCSNRMVIGLYRRPGPDKWRSNSEMRNLVPLIIYLVTTALKLGVFPGSLFRNPSLTSPFSYRKPYPCIMAPLHSELNSTLGAIFLGNIGAAILYGITTLQTFSYYKNCQKDGAMFRLLIGFLWILDSIHMSFMTHGVYQYLVVDFSNPLALMMPTWSLLSQIFVTCISDFIVRSVFTRRIWLLSGHNHFLCICIMITSLFVVASGFAFACKAFVLRSFANMIREESWMLYAGLGSAVVADGLVTVRCASSCNEVALVSRHSVVNILMIYSINTGLLTSVCAAASFITYAIWPDEFIYMGIYFALSKLYVNSLLAVLNSRASLRERKDGISTIPQSPSSIECISMGFGANTDPDVSPVLSKPRPFRFSARYK